MKLNRIIEDSNFNSVQPAGVNSWAGAKMAQDIMDPELHTPDNEPTDVNLSSPGAEETDLLTTSIDDTEKAMDTFSWMIPTFKDPTVK
jgi:hypothetical protein